jgi:Fe-S cluster biogenesis protein NfuA
MKKEVQKVINEIRPMLKRDGGDIKLIEVTPRGIVKVKLQGACSCCPHATQTLKYVVEDMLKEKVKGIKRVESV